MATNADFDAESQLTVGTLVRNLQEISRVLAGSVFCHGNSCLHHKNSCLLTVSRIRSHNTVKSSTKIQERKLLTLRLCGMAAQKIMSQTQSTTISKRSEQLQQRYYYIVSYIDFVRSLKQYPANFECRGKNSEHTSQQ